MKNRINILINGIKDFFSCIWHIVCSVYSAIANEFGLNWYDMRNSIVGYSLISMMAGILTAVVTLFFVSGLAVLAILAAGAFLVLVRYFKFVLPFIIAFSAICLARWRYLRKRKMNSENVFQKMKSNERILEIQK